MYLIINGPNLNLLGTREPEIYGNRTFADYLSELRKALPEVNIEFFQSNSEGAIIDRLQAAGADPECRGIVMNPAAYTHYSIAIADAIAAISTPVVEVHISNIHAREEYRRHSVTAEKSRAVIAGCGLDGYELALRYLQAVDKQQ
ncbi:MAG: type II 3-dehydroquinate dehydratase [Muribaculaceae bacterium]|nr:type II 3-dehydroquinate dehydratase [Muribaculaceae bacterium]